ncbi:RHS repeat-associated core domain-containing protein [Rhodococcus sp. IEGM1300]
MPTQPSNTILLATDQQRSVLIALDKSRHQPIAYTPYGHRSSGGGLLSLLGFNGEPPDPLTGHYHLGNGYRQFNPVLMRFNSPDSWSPFGKGGLNCYGYCLGNPITGSDRSGHTPIFLKNILRGVGIYKKSSAYRAEKLANSIPASASSITNLFSAVDMKSSHITRGEIIAANLHTKNKLIDVTYRNEIAEYTVSAVHNSSRRHGRLVFIEPLNNISRNNREFVKNLQSSIADGGYMDTSYDAFRQNPQASRERNEAFHAQIEARNVRNTAEQRRLNSEKYKQERKEYWSSK